MKKIIAPSILAADFLNLGSEINMCNKSSAEWIHLDIMDGHFVPNISYGFPVLKAIRPTTTKFLDVHLMIENPDEYIPQFVKDGADGITVHIETTKHLHRTIQLIKSLNVKAGVAINPHTPIEFLDEILSELDLVLIMSVNPGFGGQSFIENTYLKVKSLKNKISKNKYKCLIEIDGGVGLENSKLLYQAGADVLVAGTSVFSSENPITTIQNLLVNE